MFYTIYQITHIESGKTYIGKHQTKDLNDGYMGSGKYLKRAIEKYGLESFSKKILHVFDNEPEMNAKEAELVTEDYCLRKDTYNICVGGQGGFSHINRDENFRIQKNKYAMRQAVEEGILEKAQVVLRKKMKDKDWVESKSNTWRNTMMKRYGSLSFGFGSGNTHSEETKRKIGEANSKHQSGKNNSQYGSMWITNGIENKKIKKVDNIPDGWKKGRTVKNT